MIKTLNIISKKILIINLMLFTILIFLTSSIYSIEIQNLTIQSQFQTNTTLENLTASIQTNHTTNIDYEFIWYKNNAPIISNVTNNESAENSTGNINYLKSILNNSFYLTSQNNISKFYPNQTQIFTTQTINNSIQFKIDNIENIYISNETTIIKYNNQTGTQDFTIQIPTNHTLANSQNHFDVDSNNNIYILTKKNNSQNSLYEDSILLIYNESGNYQKNITLNQTELSYINIDTTNNNDLYLSGKTNQINQTQQIIIYKYNQTNLNFNLIQNITNLTNEPTTQIKGVNIQYKFLYLSLFEQTNDPINQIKIFKINTTNYNYINQTFLSGQVNSLEQTNIDHLNNLYISSKSTSQNSLIKINPDLEEIWEINSQRNLNNFTITSLQINETLSINILGNYLNQSNISQTIYSIQNYQAEKILTNQSNTSQTILNILDSSQTSPDDIIKICTTAYDITTKTQKSNLSCSQNLTIEQSPTLIITPILPYNNSNFESNFQINLSVQINSTNSIQTIHAILSNSTFSQIINLSNSNLSTNTYWQNISTPTNLGEYNISYFANDSYFTSNTTSNLTINIIETTNVTLNFTTTHNQSINLTINVYDNNNLLQTINNVNSAIDLTIINTSLDFQFITYNNFLELTLSDTNLTNISNQTIGFDKHSELETVVLTYAVETTYNFTSAELKISYNETNIATEANLRVFTCEDYNFTSRTCPSDYLLISTNVTQNQIDNTFTIITDSFSSFAIKELTTSQISQLSSGAGASWNTLCKDNETFNITTNKCISPKITVPGIPKITSAILKTPKIKDELSNLPDFLFDITFELFYHSITSLSELSSKITFQSFGTKDTPVDLKIKLFDDSGKLLSEYSKNIIVQTETAFFENFDKFKELDLVYGDYIITLTTIYGPNIEDTFQQNFSIVKPKAKHISTNLTILFILLLVLVIYKIININKFDKTQKKISSKNKRLSIIIIAIIILFLILIVKLSNSINLETQTGDVKLYLTGTGVDSISYSGEWYKNDILLFENSLTIDNNIEPSGDGIHTQTIEKNKNIYILTSFKDINNDNLPASHISIYDLDGNFNSKITLGNFLLDDFEVDSSGDIYIANSENENIVIRKFSESGTLIWSKDVKVKGNIHLDPKMILDKSENLLIVAEITKNPSNKKKSELIVYKINTQTSSVLKTQKVKFSLTSNPEITTNKDGFVYVTASRVNKKDTHIYHFGLDNDLKSIFNKEVKYSNENNLNSYIGIDSLGNPLLLLTGYKSNKVHIKKINPSDGKEISDLKYNVGGTHKYSVIKTDLIGNVHLFNTYISDDENYLDYHKIKSDDSEISEFKIPLKNNIIIKDINLNKEVEIYVSSIIKNSISQYGYNYTSDKYKSGFIKLDQKKDKKIMVDKIDRELTYSGGLYYSCITPYVSYDTSILGDEVCTDDIILDPREKGTYPTDVETIKMSIISPQQEISVLINSQLNLSINLTNSSEINLVQAHILLPDNITIIKLNLEKKSDNIYSNIYQIPNLIGDITISFKALSENNSELISKETFFYTIENKLPTLNSSFPTNEMNFPQGTNIKLQAEVFDEFGIKSVIGTVKAPQNIISTYLLLIDSNNKLTSPIIYSNLLGEYIYNFTIIDNNNNVLNTKNFKFTVQKPSEKLQDLSYLENEFTNKQEITIINQGNTNLINFPTFLKIQKQKEMQTNYQDLRFIQGDCNNFHSTKFIDYEIDSLNQTRANLWLKIENLSTNQINICMYYGNQTKPVYQNKENIWDENYLAVYHLSESSFDKVIKDSSDNNYDLISYGSMTQSNSIVSLIGNAIDFDGINDKLENINFDWNHSGPVTLELWNFVKTEDVKNSWAVGFKPTGNERFSNHIPWSNNFIYFDYGTCCSTGRVSQSYLSYLNSWTYSVMRSEGIGGFNQDILLNMDSVISKKTSDGPTSILQDFSIGAIYNSYHKGKIDEVRISNITRSNDWLKQSYKQVINYDEVVNFGETENLKNKIKDKVYRKQFSVFNPTESDLIDFPMFFNINLEEGMNDNFSNLLIYSGNCSENFDNSHELDFEVEVLRDELVEMWINIPLMKNMSNTLVCLVYDNLNLSYDGDFKDVWNNDFGLVYHMDNTGLDSTSNSRNRESVRGNPVLVDEFLGYGLNLDGNDAWSTKNIKYLEQQWSERAHEIIFETSNDINSRQVLFSEGGATNGMNLYIFEGKLYSRWWSESKGWQGGHIDTQIEVNSKYHAVMQMEYPGNYELFLNGALIRSFQTPKLMNVHSGDGALGYTGENSKDFHDLKNIKGYYFKGKIYEFRVYDKIRSSDWIKFTYYNILKSNNLFGTNELIIDKIPPMISNYTNFNIQKNIDDIITLNVKVTDNIKVENVSLFVIKPNLKIDKIKLNLVSQNIYEIDYNLFEDLGQYNFSYIAFDNSSNFKKIENFGIVNILDLIKPGISEYILTKNIFSTSENIKLQIKAQDTSGIKSVTAKITNPLNNEIIIELEKNGVLFSSNFILPNILGDYHLEYTVIDNSGNKITSSDQIFTSIDLTVPQISNYISFNDNLNVNSKINLSLFATDNIEIKYVLAQITNSFETKNIILSNIESNKYSWQFQIPNILGTYKINYVVSDTSNNTLTVNGGSFNVLDNIKPNILETINLESNYNTSDKIIFALQGEDNIGLLKAIIIIKLPNGEISTINLVQSSDKHFTSFYTISNQTGIFQINYELFDTSNNSILSDTQTINVFDSELPIITNINDLNLKQLNTSSIIDLSLSGIDNIGLLKAQVIITNPLNQTDLFNLTKLNNNDFTSLYTIPEILGVFQIQFKLFDTSLNLKTSMVQTFSTLDSTLPKFQINDNLENKIFQTSETINLSIVATDNIGINKVTANIKLPNQTSIQIPLSLSQNNEYLGTYKIPQIVGDFDIQYTITDSTNNDITSNTQSIKIIDTQKPTVLKFKRISGKLFVNNELELSISANDNINVQNVITQITTPFGETELVNLELNEFGEYTGRYNISNIIGIFKVNYLVEDSSENLVQIYAGKIRARDGTKPQITNFTVPNSTEPLSFVKLALTGKDNVDLKRAYARIEYPNGKIKTYRLTKLNDNEFQRNYKIPKLVGEFKIHYLLFDTSNNKILSKIRTFNVIDSINPTITYTKKIPTSAKTSDSIILEVKGRDNVALSSAIALIEFQNDEISEIKLSKISNYIFRTNYIIPGIIGEYNLSYKLTDSSNNSAISSVKTMSIIDNENPKILSINDNNLKQISTNTNLNLNLEGIDNVEILSATATIKTPNNENISIELVKTSNKFTGSYNIPELLGYYSIQYKLFDTSLNSVESQVQTFSTLDTTFPKFEILNKFNNQIYSTLQTLELSILATDNIQINRVITSIQLPNQSTFQIPLTNNQDNTFTSTFQIPQDIGDYNIQYLIIDTNNNSITSDSQTFDVIDIISPEIINFTQFNNQTDYGINSEFELSISGLDNIELKKAIATIANPNQSVTKINLDKINSTLFHINYIFPNQFGDYSIRFELFDSSNNSVSTLKQSYHVTDFKFEFQTSTLDITNNSLQYSIIITNEDDEELLSTQNLSNQVSTRLYNSSNNLQYEIYNQELTIKINNLQLSQDTFKPLKIDKHNNEETQLITYGIENEMDFETLFIEINYENLEIENVDNLIFMVCKDYNYINQKCNLEYQEISENLVHNKLTNSFNYLTINQSLAIGLIEIIEKEVETKLIPSERSSTYHGIRCHYGYSFENGKVSCIEKTYNPESLIHIEATEKILSTPTSDLFDIRFDVLSQNIYSTNDLAARLSFENFGDTPTSVNINSKIFDESGIEINSFKKILLIQTQNILIIDSNDFENLNLEPGNYSMVVSTNYGNNISDHFIQKFTYNSSKPFLKYSYTSLVLISLIFIISTALAFRLTKKYNPLKIKEKPTNKKQIKFKKIKKK
jgi:hypothetical protein